MLQMQELRERENKQSQLTAVASNTKNDEAKKKDESQFNFTWTAKGICECQLEVDEIALAAKT